MLTRLKRVNELLPPATWHGYRLPLPGTHDEHHPLYSVLIMPLPYLNSHELVSIRHVGDRGDIAATSSMYFTYRAENHAFAEIGIWQGSSATLTDADGSRRVRSLLVMDGTLQALRVQPARGRWFTAAEHGPAAEGSAPVILSHALWQRQLGGDDAALGRELALETPPSFRGFAGGANGARGRSALGAEPRQLATMFLRHGSR